MARRLTGSAARGPAPADLSEQQQRYDDVATSTP